MTTAWQQRSAIMKDHGITRCPMWCIQPNDEDNFEAHISVTTEFTTGHGQTVSIRFHQTWWEGGDDTIILTPVLDSDGELVLTPHNWSQLNAVVEQLVEDRSGAEKWAYHGAHLDEEG